MSIEVLDMSHIGGYPEYLGSVQHGLSRRVNGLLLLSFFINLNPSYIKAQNDFNMITENIEYPEGAQQKFREIQLRRSLLVAAKMNKKIRSFESHYSHLNTQ